MSLIQYNVPPASVVFSESETKIKAKKLRDYIESAPCQITFDNRQVSVQVSGEKDLIKIMGVIPQLQAQDAADPSNAPHSVQPFGWRMDDNTWELLKADDFINVTIAYASKSGQAFGAYGADLDALANGDHSLINLNTLKNSLGL